MWHVFDYDSRNDSFQLVNRMSYSDDPGSLGRMLLLDDEEVTELSEEEAIAQIFEVTSENEKEEEIEISATPSDAEKMVDNILDDEILDEDFILDEDILDEDEELSDATPSDATPSDAEKINMDSTGAKEDEERTLLPDGKAAFLGKERMEFLLKEDAEATVSSDTEAKENS